jgi:hypothetical protein
MTRTREIRIVPDQVRISDGNAGLWQRSEFLKMPIGLPENPVNVNCENDDPGDRANGHQSVNDGLVPRDRLLAQIEEVAEQIREREIER